MNQGATCIGKGFGVGFDFFHHQAAQRGGAAQNIFQTALLFAQLFELLLDLDGFQPRQLAQADVQNIVGLALAQFEAFDQRRFGFVAVADDANHLVDVEQHQLAAFQDVDARQHLVQAKLRTPLHRGLPEGNPLFQHLAQGFGHGATVQTDHGQVDGGRAFQTGVRQQGGDEFLLFNGAGFGLEHQTHRRVFAGLVAHPIQDREDGGFELGLLWAQRFFAGLHLGVGELFNFFQHLLAAHTGWQFGHHQLPLATGQVFDHPTRPHFQRAAPCGVSV